MMHDEGFDLNDCVLTAFGDPTTSRLRRLHLRHSTVTDLGLRALLKVSEPILPNRALAFTVYNIIQQHY